MLRTSLVRIVTLSLSLSICNIRHFLSFSKSFCKSLGFHYLCHLINHRGDLFMIPISVENYPCLLWGSGCFSGYEIFSCVVSLVFEWAPFVFICI